MAQGTTTCSSSSTAAADASSYHCMERQVLDDYRDFAARTIQRFYRGWAVRVRRARDDAARTRAAAAAAAHQAAAARLQRAARTIQDAWRAYHGRRVYAFYRSIIVHREARQWDPRDILRAINAPEAALVEPAAGLHVRFRLAGPGFPPVLVYKIFTHRPVAGAVARTER